MTHLATVLLAWALVFAPIRAWAQAPQADGEAILKRVADKPAPKSSAVKLRMTLVSDRAGKTYEQVRAVEIYGKQGGDGVKSLLRFSEPKDVAGVALLVIENKSAGENDQWLYMPALKQEPKRISGGQKDQSFLGTDFTFGDLSGRNPKDWQHRTLREEDVSGAKTWVIESTPKPGAAPSSYARLVQWIRQTDDVPLRVEFYDRNGLLKVLTVEEVKTIDGYTVATRTRMENVVKKHATLLEILEQKNDLDIPDSVFTTREMQRR